MRVQLVRNWQGPTERFQRDKFFNISGQRWRKGIHDMPDSLFKYLPSSAIVLEPPKEGVNEDLLPEQKPPEVNPLHEQDVDRAAADAERKAREAMEERLKKARAAKAAKAKAKLAT